MLKYGHDSGKCATRESNTVNVAQFAKGSNAPANNAAMPTTISQCGLRRRIDRQARYPKNATVSATDIALQTNGQLVTPRNGEYGGGPGSGLVVRGSPCRPVCMLASAK